MAAPKRTSATSYGATQERDDELPLWGNPGFDNGNDSNARDSIRTDGSISVSSVPVELHRMSTSSAESRTGSSDPREFDASLPSTQLRKVRGIASATSMRYRNQDDIANGDQLDGNNQFQEPGEIVGVDGLNEEQMTQMKTTTLDMRTKKSVRRHKTSSHELSCWRRFKLYMQTKWSHTKGNARDLLSTIDLWHSHMRKIEGAFGTGILAYFVFLRWLFALNLFMSVMTIFFLFIPQISFEQSSDTNKESFNGLDLLTGEGWFLKTELYYGQYTNLSITVPDSTPYYMPHAYLFVGGGYLLLCMIILVQSMANSYKDNYIVAGSKNATFTAKVFCSWDYGVMKSSKIKLQSIYNDFVESLADDQKRKKKSLNEFICFLLLRLSTNLVVLAMMSGAIYLVLLVSDKSMKSGTSKLESLLPAIAISGFNMILPFAFRIIASLEKYESGKTELNVTLWRTILLKLASLTVYVVAVLRDLTCVINKNDSCLQTDCWESLFGSLFYKLLIVDFIYLLLTTMIEPIRRVLANYIKCWYDTFGLPGFDISRNVLDLIYSQGVCWIGTFYCPLLPLINVLKLFILFYVKRYSVMRNCQGSARPFRASRMNLIFLVLLGLMQLLSLIVVGYLVINDGVLKPSETCGPFRGRDSVYDLVKSIVNKDLPEGLRETVQITSSASVITAFLFILGLVAYYFKLRKASAEKRILLLKQQITLAGRDKLFLKQKLRGILKRAASVMPRD